MADMSGMEAFTAVLERLVNVEKLLDESRRMLIALESKASTVRQVVVTREWRQKNEQMNLVGAQLLFEARKVKMQTKEMTAAIEAAEKAFDETPF